MFVITKRAVLASFAKAQNVEGLRGCEFDGSEFGALMRPVTERLTFR